MNAGRALGWLYARAIRGMDEDQRLKVDRLLGMPGSEEVIAERREEAVAMSGFEVVR